MHTSLKLIGVYDRPVRLELAGGACAVAVNQADSALPQGLEVYDAEGRLVLRYEPSSARVTLGFSLTTLTVDEKTGDTALRSAGKLTLTGTDVEVLGQRSAVLGVRTALGHVGASVAVGAQRIAVLAKRFDLRAERENTDVKHSNTTAESVTVTAQHLRHQATKHETVAGTIMTKAKEAWAYIEGESRVEANRATWKVAQTLWFRSKRAFLKTDKDVNIDGEKINLG